jgi:hypothetical protein
VQPLYVPADEELPTFSERSRRLGGIDATDEIASFVRGPGLKFLERLRTPAELAEWLEREETGHKPDPFALEALAYSLVLSGHEEDGERWLELARETAGAYIRDDVAEDLYSEDEEHPLEPVVERVAQVREALEQAPDAAIELLDRWRKETAQNLGVSDYLAPLDRSRNPSA